MSLVRTRLSIDVATGTEVRRADAIFAVLSFAVDYLRLSRSKPLLEKGVRDRQWITDFWIVSQDDDKVVHEELIFRIDWERHSLHLASGDGTITVPNGKGVVSSVSPELIRTLRMIEENRAANGHSFTYYVSHREDPEEDVVKALGLGKGSPLRYAGERLEVKIASSVLDELGASYNRYGRSLSHRRTNADGNEKASGPTAAGDKTYPA